MSSLSLGANVQNVLKTPQSKKLFYFSFRDSESFLKFGRRMYRMWQENTLTKEIKFSFDFMSLFKLLKSRGKYSTKEMNQPLTHLVR